MDLRDVINYILSIVLLAGVGFETYLIYKRNRTVRMPGKDDFMTMMLVIWAVMFVIPLNQMASEIEAIRNILTLLFVFSTFAIKRGVNEKGIVKVFFTIPWRHIRQIQVDQHQLNLAKITFRSDKFSVKLVFPMHTLSRTLDFISAHCPAVLVDASVQAKINSMPQS